MEVDLYVSYRIRELRTILGLTQQQMAELIGVTYQQAHKYETGVNRITVGRLYQLAQVLEVDVGYFFAGVDAARPVANAARHQRAELELARSFLAIANREYQEALCSLARTLAGVEADVDRPAIA